MALESANGNQVSPDPATVQARMQMCFVFGDHDRVLIHRIMSSIDQFNEEGSGRMPGLQWNVKVHRSYQANVKH